MSSCIALTSIIGINLVASATGIGDTVTVGSAGMATNVGGTWVIEVTQHIDMTSTEDVFCLEQNYTGGDGTATLTELIGQTTRIHGHGVVGNRTIKWEQVHVTDVAGIVNWVYNVSSFTGMDKYTACQGFIWSYLYAGYLEGIPSASPYYLGKRFYDYSNALVSYVGQWRNTHVGHGILYSKSNGNQELAKFSWEEIPPPDVPDNPKLRVAKRDADSGAIVKKAGFKFNIYGPNSSSKFVTTLTTTTSGYTPTYEVAEGTYYVKETAVPDDDYLLSSDMPSKKVSGDGTTITIDFENEPAPKLGGIRIYKDFEENVSGSAYSLAGAVYGIYSNSSCTSSSLVKRLTTNSSGTAATSAEELEAGTYYVKEISPSPGCELDTTRYTVTVPGGSYAIVRSDEPIITGKIQVQKQDENGNDLDMSGFVFTATSGSMRRTATTNSSGLATFNDLPLGSWTIRETTTQPPYLLNSSWSASCSITESNASRTFTYECENEPGVGKVALTKTDKGSGKPIQGIEFELHVGSSAISFGGKTATFNSVSCTANALLGTYETDADGKIIVNNLPLGTGNTTAYYFVEKTPPAPYTVENGWRYDFSLTYSQSTAVVSTSVNAKNVPATGKAELVKVDGDTGRKLSGAVFKVIAQEDIIVNGETVYEENDVITGNESLTTDDDGKSTTTALPIDDDGEAKYAFVEVQEPIGYQLDTTPHPFTIKYVDANTPSVPTVSIGEIKNLPVYGGIEIHKVDLDIAQVNGTDVDGQVQGNATTFDGIRFEIVNESTYSIAIDDVEYQPSEKLGEIELEDGSKGYLTIKDGVAKTAIDALPYGDYAITEVAETTPDGYLINSTTWHVKIRNLEQYHYPTGDEIENKISNDIAKGKLEMPKIDHDFAANAGLGQADATNNPQGDASMVGAEFSIENASANPVIVGGMEYASGVVIETIPLPDGGTDAVITSDSNGIASTAEHALPYGTYIVRETKAPEGYQLNAADSWAVTIDEDGQTIRADGDDRIDDEVFRGGVAMPKVDTELTKLDGEETKEGNPQGNATFEGAQFTIRNRSMASVVVGGVLYELGDDVMTIETGADGIASTASDVLPYGTYDIRETKAPEGYELTDEIWTFEIREDGKIVRPDKENDVESKIDNQVIRGGVAMPKVDTELSQFAGEETKEGNPQGDATVKGATFEIRNVSTNHVLVEGTLYEPGDVVKTIVTGDDGVASTGNDALPYGRYEIYEIEAPTGYHLSSDTHEGDKRGEVWTFDIKDDGEIVRPAEDEVESKIDNQVIRGGVQMPKVDTEFTTLVNGEDMDENFVLDENHPQGDATVDGAEFSITNVSAHHVIVGGQLYEPGERIMTIPDGNRGGNLYDVIVTVNGVAKTTADALPFGTYELREVKTPTGYHNSSWNHDDDDAGEVWTFTVREEGVLSRPDDKSHAKDDTDGIDNKIDNKVIRGGVEIPKIDTETSKYDGQTDEDNPQGDATLAGATFSLTNASAHEVYVGGQVYVPGERITTIPDGNADGTISDVITTDDKGVARTTNDALPYGTYELREVDQPDGYNHSSFNHKDDDSGEVWTFTIRVEDEMVRPDDERHSENDEDGVENKIDNRVIRGGVRMPKFDALLVKQPGYEEKENQPTGDATLDGAEFAIENASVHHIIVGGKLYESGDRIQTIPDANNGGKTSDVIVTVDGVAKTTADALPYGTYMIYEVKAPDGYELGTDSFIFEIREEGVIVQPTDGETTAKIKDMSTTTEFEPSKTDTELNEHSDADAAQPAGDDAGIDVLADAADGDGSAGVTETSTSATIDDPAPTRNDAGIDTNPKTNAQGDATLDGAEFYVINRSNNMVVVGGAVYQPDERIITLPLPDGTYGDVVTSDASGAIAFGEEGLPYGTYEIGEETAPEGYNLSDDTWVVEIHGEKSKSAVPSDYDGQKVTSSSDPVKPQSVSDSIEDKVIRGGLSVQKVDKETGRGDSIVTGVGTIDDSDESVDGSDTADADDASESGVEMHDDVADGDAQASCDETGSGIEGGNDDGQQTPDQGNGESENADDTVESSEFHNASLAGTMFEIRNASEKAVIVDSKIYQVGQVVKTITTDDRGYAATEPDALPYGTYDVYEVGAPNGYISSADSYGNSDGIDDESEKTFVQTVEIREEGVIVPCARPFANQIKRGDIRFTKIDDDGNAMAHVAFRVTSKTTGESHVIVSDENGVYDSSSAVIPHSQNTNANDDAFLDNGNVDDDALVYDAGTWFYGNTDGKAFHDDENQTLQNNADRFNQADVTVDGDDAESDDESDNGAGDDVTYDGDATDGDTQGGGDSMPSNDDDVDMLADSGAPADDNSDPVLGDDVESGSGSMGSTSAPPHVNPVYEVTGEDGASKQVTIGYIETDENGSFESNSVVFNADGSITIVYDKTVVDMNTGERRSYTSYETYAEGTWKVIVVGSDMLDGTNADGIADADGNGEYDIIDNLDAYSTTSQFPMHSVDDNLGAFPYDEYVFEELPSKATYGRNLVAFEATVQRHNYVLDLGPITDNIITLRTTATDQTDGDHVLNADGTVTIVDRVEYTNLNTDREYVLTGTLMDYETNAPMTDADGNAITSTVTFTPSAANGSIDVVFELDASQLGGVRAVVFEDLYWNGIHLASHADIEDKNQLVEFHPEIGTVAVGDQTDDHYVYDDSSVIIVDTVHYKGVVPGREFIVHGILMDKNTGDALIDSNGNTVENSVVFTPETSEGDVEVLFEFDASTLAGLDVVAFENLYRIDTVTNRAPDDETIEGDGDGRPDDVPSTQRLIASHADINDESQTVSIRSSDLASDSVASNLVQTGAIVGAGIAATAAVAGATAYAVKRKQQRRK